MIERDNRWRSRAKISRYRWSDNVTRYRASFHLRRERYTRSSESSTPSPRARWTLYTSAITKGIARTRANAARGRAIRFLRFQSSLTHFRSPVPRTESMQSRKLRAQYPPLLSLLYRVSHANRMNRLPFTKFESKLAKRGREKHFVATDTCVNNLPGVRIQINEAFTFFEEEKERRTKI